MRRRDFVTFLGGATAWAATARAQKSQRVIGVLGSASYGAFPGTEAAFIEGLRAVGFMEGKNLSIEWRWAEGQYDRLSSLAGDLVGREVTVIVAFDVPAAFAEGGNQNHPYCLFGWRRSSQIGPRRQPQPTSR
jgi:putative ABC transport system substrate-binding protein